MRHCLILFLLSFVPIVSGAVIDTLDGRPAIPVFTPYSGQPLLQMQVTASAGTARVARSDKPLFSTTLECKGVYHLSGNLYVSGGSGLGIMRSEARPVNGDRYERQVFLAYTPAGIGFSIGDDRATIITGLDVLPGVYFHDGAQPLQSRRFAYGLGPEFGFLFHPGRRSSRGFALGMTGKIRFMQSPDLADGGSLRYCYGGIGLMVRF
jgi:hypothetical protein